MGGDGNVMIFSCDVLCVHSIVNTKKDIFREVNFLIGKYGDLRMVSNLHEGINDNKIHSHFNHMICR